MFRFTSSFKAKRFKEIIKYLANFLKTNPTKFAVICVKKASKGTFLKPEKLQNQSNERKGKEKRKSEEKERRRRKKKAMVALLGFIRVTLEMAHFDILAEFFANN